MTWLVAVAFYVGGVIASIPWAYMESADGFELDGDPIATAVVALLMGIAWPWVVLLSAWWSR